MPSHLSEWAIGAIGSSAAGGPLDAAWWLGGLGAVGVFIVLFAETGLFVGFFLPGDSLLFTAGALCAAGPDGPARMSLPWLLLAAFGGAVCGAQTGYLIGRRAGHALLAGRRPRLEQAIHRGGRLLSRFGAGKALVLARFIPVLRTIISPLAGAMDIPVREFTAWQAAGALIWTAGTTGTGYLAARMIPGVTAYVVPVLCVVTAASVLVAIVRASMRRSKRFDMEGTTAGGTGHGPAHANAAQLRRAELPKIPAQ